VQEQLHKFNRIDCPQYPVPKQITIVPAINHYTEFGPGSVNIFRNMLGLSQSEWKEAKGERQESPSSKQRTLSDSLN